MNKNNRHKHSNKKKTRKNMNKKVDNSQIYTNHNQKHKTYFSLNSLKKRLKKKKNFNT